MLLNVVQSADCSCPVLTVEAKGIFIVREFVEVLMLKIFPAVPVDTEVITLDANPMVVEVPMIICLPSPAVKVNPEPRPRLPREVVPVPPFETASSPVTSEEPKLIAPLKRLPELSDLTGPATREEIVVEPLAETWNRVEPVEDERVNSAMLGTEVVP